MPVVGPYLFNKKHLLPALEELFGEVAETEFLLRDRPGMTDLKLARAIAREARLNPLVLGKASEGWVHDDNEIPGGIRPKTEVTHSLVSAYFDYEGYPELWHWLPGGFKPLQVQGSLGSCSLAIEARGPLGNEDQLFDEVEAELEKFRAILAAQREEVERYNADLPDKARTWVEQHQRAIAKREAIEARLAKLSF